MTAPASVFHGVEVPESLLAAEMQHHQAGSFAESRKQAGRALAVRAVLLDLARRNGVKAVPQKNADGQEETQEEALIREALSSGLDPEPATADDIRAVYDAHPQGFHSPDLVEASHILLSPSGDAPGDWDDALGLAAGLVTQLAGDPGAFARLAAAHSACASASEGGALGQLGPGDVVEPVWNALMSLDVGGVTAKPVRSRFGWHILRLDQREPGQRLPFEYVKSHIAMRLDSKAWSIAALKLIDQLLAQSAESLTLKLDSDGKLDLTGGTVARAGAMLGSVISNASAAYASLDEATRAIVHAAAERESAAPEEVLRTAINRFLAQADDELWTRVLSKFRDGEEPLDALLTIIVNQQLPPVRTSHTLISLRDRMNA